jgi:hypothetical protein
MFHAVESAPTRPSRPGAAPEDFDAMKDLIKVKIAGVLGVITVTFQDLHNAVGFGTALCAFGYAATKWYFLIQRNKQANKNNEG